MRKGVGVTGVVGRPPVPMPVNGGHEVTATTTTDAPVSPTRRAVLRTIVTIVALAALAVLAGCGTSTKPTAGVAPSTRPTPGATAGGVAPSTPVMIIGHGEKPDDTNPGVDANGNQDDIWLTEIAGWALITYLTLALCVFTWAAARPAPPAGPGSAAVPTVANRASFTPNPAVLARPAGRPSLDLPATTRPTGHLANDPWSGIADGPRERHLGLPPHPGRAHPQPG